MREGKKKERGEKKRNQKKKRSSESNLGPLTLRGNAVMLTLSEHLIYKQNNFKL